LKGDFLCFERTDTLNKTYFPKDNIEFENHITKIENFYICDIALENKIYPYKDFYGVYSEYDFETMSVYDFAALFKDYIKVKVKDIELDELEDSKDI